MFNFFPSGDKTETDVNDADIQSDNSFHNSLEFDSNVVFP